MKKFLAIILAVMLCASLLASCTETAPSEEAVSAAPEPVELRTVGMFGGSDPSAAAYEDVIDKFMDEYDYITIKDESATSDPAWQTQVNGDITSGNEADVLFFYTDAIIGDNYKKFVDLDTIKAEYPDYGSNITESVWDFVKAPDGKNYAIPMRGFWEGLFVNTDVFTANNLELPTDWAKFEAAIDALPAKQITPIAAAVGQRPHYLIEHFVLAVGGIEGVQLAKTIGTDTAKISQDWIDAFTLFKTLADKKAFPSNTATIAPDDSDLIFTDKKAAMMLEGSWFCGTVTKNNNGKDTTVMAMPAMTSKKDPSDIVAGYSSGFYISQKAWDDEAKRDACVKFVMAATNAEAQAAYCASGGAPTDGSVKVSATGFVADGANMAAASKRQTPPTDAWLKTACNEALRAGANDIAKGTAKDVKKVLEDAIAKNA